MFHKTVLISLTCKRLLSLLYSSQQLQGNQTPSLLLVMWAFSFFVVLASHDVCWRCAHVLHSTCESLAVKPSALAVQVDFFISASFFMLHCAHNQCKHTWHLSTAAQKQTAAWLSTSNSKRSTDVPTLVAVLTKTCSMFKLESTSWNRFVFFFLIIVKIIFFYWQLSSIDNLALSYPVAFNSPQPHPWPPPSPCTCTFPAVSFPRSGCSISTIFTQTISTLSL